MTEDRRETIKVFLEIVSRVALVVAGVYAIWQYSDVKTKEYQQPLWDAQVRLYFEVSDLAARLTNDVDYANWESDRRRFFELYWGSMILVEDEAVEKEMVQFGTRLHAFDPTSADASAEKDMAGLREASHALSYACRDSINRGISRKAPTGQHRKDFIE